MVVPNGTEAARDFDLSKAFYQALGFKKLLDGDVAIFGVGASAFILQYFVVIFFNTALVGAAIALLDGGRPTLGAALKLALSRIGAILGYAVISATAGVLLQALASGSARSGA